MTGHSRTAAVIHPSPKKTLRLLGPLARVLLSMTAQEARKSKRAHTAPTQCDCQAKLRREVTSFGILREAACGAERFLGILGSGRGCSAKITAP